MLGFESIMTPSRPRSGAGISANPIAIALPRPASSVRSDNGSLSSSRGATDPLQLASDARLRDLVTTYFDFVWRSLRGLGVPAAHADDAAQQVFWVATRKLDAIKPGSERSYLFATAKGIAANARRSQLRNREESDELAVSRQVDESANPEQALARSEARRTLERILNEMPDDAREVFVLFELEGLTVAAIAEVLSIPAGTAASRLRRARECFERATSELHAAELEREQERERAGGAR